MKLENHNNRQIEKIITGKMTSDGAGVNLKRLIGSPELNMLDPFLLLDEFHSDNKDDYIAGFPKHPHRGFETVTYMLAGKIRHKDSTGREGVVETGGVQWMTAGKGIIHSEMPEQEQGLLWGFQLWINLPAIEKMTSPRYQEFDASQIPTENRNGNVSVKVITGETSQGTVGPVTDVTTAPLFMDISIPPETDFSETLNEVNSVFIYVYKGKINLPDQDGQMIAVDSGNLIVLTHGTSVSIKTEQSDARCLLVSARPLNEPVARGGPFVMNTRDEIIQAFKDFNQVPL